MKDNSAAATPAEVAIFPRNADEWVIVNKSLFDSSDRFDAEVLSITTGDVRSEKFSKHDAPATYFVFARERFIFDVLQKLGEAIMPASRENHDDRD